MEVHKFSKFIHGCAVLLPEEVIDERHCVVLRIIAIDSSSIPLMRIVDL